MDAGLAREIIIYVIFGSGKVITVTSFLKSYEKNFKPWTLKDIHAWRKYRHWHWFLDRIVLQNSKFRSQLEWVYSNVMSVSAV